MQTLKNILLISTFAVLASCTTQYVQITQTTAVKKKGLTYNEDNRIYEYSDQACTITYNMWSIGGLLQYTITNKTDHILYIDNSRSFLVKNGISFLAASRTPKEDYIEKAIIAPHATASITGPSLNSVLWLNCDLERKPNMNQPATITFTQEETPLLFRSIICYTLSNETSIHLVDNAFYVSRVTNYCATDLYEKKSDIKTNCINVEGYNTSNQVTYNLHLFAPSNGYKRLYAK